MLGNHDKEWAMWGALAVAALLALSLSCASSAAAGPLGGSAWRLVQIQSMDDQVFTPDERSRYTLAFEADGRLALRADCNRGHGTWSFTAPSGLVFGPLATTRAACPPGSLHDRFLSDLGYVRSFVLEGGHLFLATFADGAILEFEPLLAAGPAFDCAEAEGSVEELVCGDDELASLDRTLAGVYERALAKVPAGERRLFKATQRGWIKGRNDCWKAPEVRACARHSYEERITELQVQSGEVEGSEPVVFTCGAGDAITAVYYRDSALPSALLTRSGGDPVLAFQSPSGSGARYEGRNVSLWDKGGEARVSWSGEELRCRAR